MSRAKREQLSRTLNSHLNNIHETFQVLTTLFSISCICVILCGVLWGTIWCELLFLMRIGFGSNIFTSSWQSQLGWRYTDGRASLQTSYYWYSIFVLPPFFYAISTDFSFKLCFSIWLYDFSVMGACEFLIRFVDSCLIWSVYTWVHVIWI